MSAVDLDQQDLELAVQVMSGFAIGDAVCLLKELKEELANE
jgi:hypothetical protein